MKRLEDIEKMSFEELEKVSRDGGVRMPQGFGERLEGGIAGLALLVLVRPGTPEDSFDDPRLAYAEVQKSFSLISEKLGKGTELVLEAAPAMNRPKEIIDKLKK